VRLAGQRLVLGVSGGIASYKTCTLARRLTEAGALVDVVLTRAAAEFVGPVTFEALTGRPVLTSLWDRGRPLSHLHLAHDPELVAVAPATAHLIARAAQGLADDPLTAILLAANVPVLLAPAMNDRMYAHPATQRNLDTLKQRGWTIVGPATGDLAEGPSDLPGRMSEPEELFAWIERLLRGGTSPLAGQRVVVTAGPTREALDPVRVITNRSSGRMGYALAEAAFARGADVLLISGPTTLPAPAGVALERVETTAQLARAVGAALKRAAVLVMAAAPSDFRPAAPARQKRPRDGSGLTLALAPTPDVLVTTKAQRKRGATVVGFAFETGADVERARRKLRDKGLHLLVVNRADEPGAGAEVETNRVTLLTGDGATELPLMSKRDVAEHIFDAVERLR
jgi:phosphopantothenoylcysteine decarboxylase / phosphopantothenate---cysteine ligase